MKKIENKHIDLNLLKKQVKAIDLKYSGERCDENQKGLINPQSLLSQGFHECLGHQLEDYATQLGFILSASMIRYRQTGLPILFCYMNGEAQEYGALYACGLHQFGIAAEDILCVEVKKEQELYWVAEESLSCQQFSALVIIGIEREKIYNFTVSRRLKIRSEHTPVPLYLLRHWKYSGATAADARWRVARLPSFDSDLPSPGMKLIGSRRFQLTLEKPLCSGTQCWEFEYDTACGFRVAQPLANRPYRKKARSSRAA